ncbi:RNA polymerase sigma factor [Deinococcus aluminii]|uniref:ECF RNA polymerase sigma factor RpoE n=1 Tax=Deinococcus aluminii TaxID=1656885 RepID=A0ABP9XFR6_9DEIO
MDEETLLMLRLRRGDGEALAELHRRVGRHVYAVAYHLLHHREEAEEVVQDTFTRVVRGADSYHPELGSPRAFIYTIARNAALSRLRARSARPVMVDPEELPPDHLPAPAPDLETRVIVQSAVQHLTIRDQALILDAFFDGLSHPEIAAKRQLPLGTVKSRLRRALLAMRERLEDS